jgi:protein gp37
MYRRFESVDKDPTVVRKTQNFNLPVRKLRAGEYKGFYKIPPGSHIYTCFSSDFFHKDADELRDEAWDMMRTRSDCTFFMITKRPERIAEHLPYDWGNGWNHVTIAVTTENQWAVDKRLPIYLALPLPHKSVMVEPMLSAVNLRPYFREYPGLIESVSVGGESGPEARPCDLSWVLDLHCQRVENGVSFSYHQTGARLIKNGKEYNIPREHQHTQAHKAHLDYDSESGLLSLHEMPGE